MKNGYFLLTIMLLWFVMAIPAATIAQDCSGYLLLAENAEYEILNYNQRDKLTGKVMYKVTDVRKQGDKSEATIHTKMYDDKGKLASEGSYQVGCESGSIWIDMRSLMNPEMMEAYKNMEIRMEGDHMDYPATLSPGQKLKDGSFTINIVDKGSGQNISTITMAVTDRTVGERQQLEVPAGTYQGFKINQQMEMQTRAMGMKMPGTRMQTVEWFVPGTGWVKSESYRNGKLVSYSVLNKITK
ncbi:hypothetical protein H9Q13_17105 [Pontibacter sp. JH31]|uniref:DUF3108 domain-containing protein n=1 Tax=Pontibacter aquaedesilientis TaxID=2766980 RepID=A0ABR7XN99_9BACT|nr:hypothetical protein [Pontibacter aquaedesilientis]MBD1398891.1 hypothetical protein [Pontibacter aquaedesilientis]